MVWLDTMTQTGQGLYLDIWKREKSRTGAGVEMIAGILGDGNYEGEVLVEIGPGRCDVTFVDQLLDPVPLRDFFTRINREQLIADLQSALGPVGRENIAGLPLFRRDPPVVDRPQEGFLHESMVRETICGWTAKSHCQAG